MAGQPLKCDDIISYVLVGLGHEYYSFVSSIYARNDPVTLKEVYSLLIVTESCLTRHHLSTPAPFAEANIAQRQPPPSNNRSRGGSRGRGRHNNYRGGVLSPIIEVTHIILLLLCVKSAENMAILLASATIVLISPINILLLLQINRLLLQQTMAAGRMTGIQTQVLLTISLMIWPI
jgi:hypothetical protein